MSKFTRKRTWRQRGLARPLGSDEKRVIRRLLRVRDGNGCCYCRCLLEAEGSGEDVTLEHLVDWADGGSNDPGNLLLAHRDCNWAAKDLTVDDKLLRIGDALLAEIETDGEQVAA